MAANKLLSADTLFALIRAGFEQVPGQRAENASISLPDALMSGFAMFSLKDPSLLAFDERRATDSNLKSIYSIAHVPGDTQMRTILDDVEPVSIRPVFKDVLRQLQRSKELDKFIFLGGNYLVSLDGTGYFSSKKIHCSSCLQKVNKKTGEVTSTTMVYYGFIGIYHYDQIIRPMGKIVKFSRSRFLDMTHDARVTGRGTESTQP
jgi:hypothetical protein